tara:strand:+ start:93 stop:245 length:153 start_codon:yes stop_codon:yes gene_type:complete
MNGRFTISVFKIKQHNTTVKMNVGLVGYQGFAGLESPPQKLILFIGVAKM